MWKAEQSLARSIALTSAAILLCTAAVRAMRLYVDSYEAASAVIRFELPPHEATRLPRRFSFALTQTPRAKLVGTRVITSPPHLPATVHLLDTGWMGADFTGWYTVEVQKPDALPRPADALEGRIVIEFDRAVFTGSGDRRSVPRPEGGILRLPVRRTMAKRTSIDKPAIPFTRGIRMEIGRDGVYRITGHRLQSLGVPIGSIAASSYRLYTRGREIPLLLTSGSRSTLGVNDEILFYATALRGATSHYTDYATANVYWLAWGEGRGGARVATVSGSKRRDEKVYVAPGEQGATLTPHEFADTLHIEVDSDIRWLAEVSQIEEVDDEPSDSVIVDNWYWDILGRNELQEVTIDLPGPSESSVHEARFRIAFTGLTSSDTVDPDHHVEVYLNHERLPDVAIWDGQRPYVHTTHVPLESIKHGENTVTFGLPRRGHWDQVALNWIEVAYVRNFRASANTIMVRTNPADVGALYQFELDGFSTTDLELWDIDRHRFFSGFDITSKTRKGRRSYSLVFQDSLVSPTRFYAQATGRRMSPANMQSFTIDDDWEFAGGVDYLMITTADMAASLRPLARAHERNGLRVALVDIQDIYNRFSHGIPDPESIRTMLRYVFARHPDSPPRFLLLGGDCTHDLYKKNEERTKVPTRLTRVPGWGLSSDDGYFGTVRGDDNFCDLAVGRFPARDAREMTRLVTKTVGYLEGVERGYWKDNLLLCGGEDREFTTFNNKVMSDIVGPRMTILRIDGNTDSPYFHSGLTAPRRVADYINAGVRAINFTGHGGGAVWSDGPIFHYNDLSLLYNDHWPSPGRLPIIFSFTCLTGFFESAFYRSLGEEFLRFGPAGAVAFYGGSGYSKKGSDIELSRTVLRNAMRGHSRTLGELLRVSETSMLVRFGSVVIPHVRQYNLLGDPALPWHLTADSLELSLDQRTLAGADTLVIRGTTTPVRDGKAKVRVSSNGVEWSTATVEVAGGGFVHRIPLKRGATTAEGIVSAYAWNATHEVRGWTSFTKDTLALHEVSITPAEPAIGDSVVIRCRIAPADSTRDAPVRCLYTLADVDAPTPDWTLFPAGVAMVRDTGDGYWISARPVLLSDPQRQTGPTTRLLVKFRVEGELAESRVYPFAVTGRPDLVFTDDSIEVFWDGDSLRVRVEVLNKGTAESPPFPVAFFMGDRNDEDTLYRRISDTPLAPGEITTITFTLPDTQGLVRLRGILDAEGAVSEGVTTNNGITGSARLAYADLHRPTDTLRSPGGGLIITPRDTLPRATRLFLFGRAIAQRMPLRTESAWIGLLGDGRRSFHLNARPPLGESDTLQWTFRADPGAVPERGSTTSGATAEAGIRVFGYRIADSTWHNRGGKWQATRNYCRLATADRGPLALGSRIDTSGPTAQMFVAGREVLFLDYAARNRPFTIVLHDPSGVDPASVELLLNGSPLPEDRHSSVTIVDDPATASITAYPPPLGMIDTLVVRAADYAGNRSQTPFAYMPGEDLRIRFFSCHPNPFTVHTSGGGTKLVRFAYLLTDIADKVTLSIHTMSGRKIWTWKSEGDLIGYQEVAWNGITATGHRIANGTYYAKLIAVNREKRVHKTIRIAKLEGY